jgi:hypothetical protein
MGPDVVEQVHREGPAQEMVPPFRYFIAAEFLDLGDGPAQFTGQSDYELTLWPFKFFATRSCSAAV